MPAIFYRAAFQAATGGELPAGLGNECFENWERLAEALDSLSPEQRCDAVYADWLLQLHSPAHQALLQIRNLLIGQGALAANYLAELAQNADDAADGAKAEIRILLVDDWLLVSNNGRKVTSMNLLGLSRFFVHAAGRIQNLDAETIGRFGIGFKSSYRFASEVLIHSWDHEGGFTFRLPICQKDQLDSHPNLDRLKSLRTRLSKAGVQGLEDAFSDVRNLGYCTPEYCTELPPELDRLTTSLREPKRGTLFCFRIRPDRRDEVARRMSGQSHEVYELCPLFLPNVRLVQLGHNELRMKVTRHDPANDFAGRVMAVKIELTTHVPGQRPSVSRFWRLEGIADGDLWQVALHADSQHRLRVEQEEDEHGTTIKDGAAYVFFPLNAVTWPLRLHLHIKLPTNLARDNWNPDETTEVQEQIRRAVAGLAGWLEQHTGKWHPQWRVESLLAQKPNQSDTWAVRIWDNLRQSCKSIRLLRTLAGGFATSTEARAVPLLSRPEARSAWAAVLATQPNALAGQSLVEADTEISIVTEKLAPDEIVEICSGAADAGRDDDDIQRSVLIALLAYREISLRAIDNGVDTVRCRTAGGVMIPLRELLEQPSGAELTQSWHETFAMLARWSDDAPWRNTSVAGMPLQKQLAKLETPVFNPTWRELLARFPDEAAWQRQGGTFWKTPRQSCPAVCVESAVTTLRVPNSNGRWLSIADLWLDDDSPVDCFAGLLAAWPLQYTDTERKRLTGLLKEWGVFEGWERMAKKKLADQLPDELTRRMMDNADRDALGLVFNHAFEEARDPLDGGWKYLVATAEKTAVSRFAQARVKEGNMARKIVLSVSISAPIRAALSLSESSVSAPLWLTDSGFQRICRLGLQETLGFEFLSQQEFPKQRERLGRQLLEGYYDWPTDPLDQTQLTGLNELCLPTSLKQRREWQVGLGPQKLRRLRDLIAVRPIQREMSDADKLWQRLLDQAEWRGEPLPSALAQVPALAESCIQPEKLETEIKHGTLTPLDREQLAPEMQSLPEASGVWKLLGSPTPLNIKWRYDGEVVATLDDAAFVIEGDRLIVHQFRPPADENQCQRILNVFETNAVADADYQADAALPPYERYQKHRDTIRRTLLKELVSKAGYEKHHILRELLQNAESAYASKRERPPEAWFEFTVEKSANSGRRKVSARHAGRAFDEPDSTGHKREDVERIWRLAAENQRTPDEVGRFNRGFKTVFSVATNGSVRIRSGDFDFEVIDLLMLKPAEPKPNRATHSPLTEFFFEATFGHALEMFRLDAPPVPATVLPILSSASFVFLGYLQCVTVKFEQQTWQWRIVRQAGANGWSHIAISKVGVPQDESFDVFAGTGPQLPVDGPNRRYAAAVRLGPNRLPIVLDKAWRKFRLTFETEHDFPLDFLVNGDFESDQGRVGLRNIARSGLVELAYDAVLQRAQQEIRASRTSDVWLAWARVLHLREAASEFEASSELRSLRSQANKAAEFFISSVPHAGDLVPVGSLTFPTTLVRRLAATFGADWGIDSTRWIDADVAAALPDMEQHKHSFHTWLNNLSPDAPVLQLIERDLRSPKFIRLRFSAPEQDELKEAKQVLAEKLRPVAPPPMPEIEMPEVEPWTVENLWHWWERHGKPEANYILEGNENWQLLYPGDLTGTQGRRARLKQDLLAATTDSGKKVWYRLFGLACLMSAGRRMTELRDFWRGSLDARQFWESTSGVVFGQGTDALFDDLMKHRFANLIASGEHAYFWRRIFYDIRKIHKLVWNDEFPDTMLRLVQNGRGGDLLNFLKTGTLSGQNSWSGVFGQSAGAPLFFLVRELVRLEVIVDPAVRPLAYFVSTPVRRALRNIGWIDEDDTTVPNFEELAALSQRLHDKIMSDPIYGKRLLPYHDLPLLHLGLNG